MKYEKINKLSKFEVKPLNSDSLTRSFGKSGYEIRVVPFFTPSDIMAGRGIGIADPRLFQFRFKCDELLRIAPYLQCHRCKDIPGPSGAKKLRYSCVNSSHVLCEAHKAKCPCGSSVGKKPSEAIAKLLQDLPYLCHNYEQGYKGLTNIFIEIDADCAV